MLALNGRHHANDLLNRPAAPAHVQHAEPLLLDKHAVAALLGVSRATVERLTTSGELPSVKVLGARRYARADVLTYVDRLRK